MSDHTTDNDPIVVTIPLELGPLVRLLREPYEIILDRLLIEGKISDSERDLFRQNVKEAEERLFAEPPLLLSKRPSNNKSTLI